ncbi:MAG: DUF937 domain-containing protein [Rubripirellula sp.]
MSDLLDLVSQHLNQDTIATLSRSIGADPQQTQQAIGAALPTLLGGLVRNAAQPDGQQQLHGALDRDHDGSILGQLGSLFGQKPAEIQAPEKTTAGGAILDHILGGRRSRVESGVSQSSGLTSGQTIKLLMMLAPMLMGILGKRQKEEKLSPGGLGDLLRGEEQKVETSGGGGLIGKVFDQDGDGDFDMMDMMKFGAGKLFGS